MPGGLLPFRGPCDGKVLWPARMVEGYQLLGNCMNCIDKSIHTYVRYDRVMFVKLSDWAKREGVHYMTALAVVA